MDRTNRDGDGREDGSLDETLPSTDSGDAHVSQRETRPTGELGAVADLGIERGAEIGRYVVLEPLGSGTMGLVVAAYDPTLDRKVAIKVVRLDPTGTTTGRQRLIREAQAMAKLQHPNVVTVFEVGTFRDQLYLAMEYVAGATLGDWLHQAGRTQREIVAAFIAAGQGLAAAHRANIVHRDFKPANVLVDTDGRVRVADFGLATATDAPAPPVSLSISRDSDPGPLGMTKTGAVLGTPAYMSPEQYLGEVADARADQYSFCVALYEALYGELPFEGTTFLVYRDNVIAGRVRDAPKDSAVPARIRRALLRGLSAAPSARYPDVDRLLADLGRDRGVGRIALVGGAAAVVAALGIALFARTSGGGGGDPCASADEPIATVWTSVQRGALEKSFVATGSPGAPAAFARIAAALDQRVALLRAERRDACVATAVRHEQSEQLLDRRVACVDQRAAATNALIDVLVDNHDPDTLAKGMQAVLALPPVETCADRTALLAGASLPPPAIRAKVDDLERQLGRVEAMINAGVWVKGADELERIVPAADQVAWPATAARAHHLAATAHLALDHLDRGIAELRKTGELAAAAGDDQQVASALIGLYGAVGYRLGHVEEARGLESAAAVAVLRAGSSPLLQGQLENSRGLSAMGSDDYLGAAKHFQASADQLTKVGHSKIAEVADALTNEGTTLTWAEHYDEAKAAHEKALALRIETLGADHPSVGYSYHGLGILYDNMGDPTKALEQFKKSAAINEKAYPPDSAHAAKDLVSIGLVLGELEQRDAAVDALERAVATFERHAQDTKHEMSTALFDLGLAYLNAHRTKDALATMQRALASAEAENGPDSDEVASVLGGLLAAADMAGQHDRAREFGERALAIREKVNGPTSQAVARVLGDLADNAISRKDLPTAMKLIDRALAIMTAPGAPAVAVKFTMLVIRANAELGLGRADAALADARSAREGFAGAQQPMAAAESRLTVAEALWKQGNRRDAIIEAKAALDALQAQPKPDETVLAKAKAWLAAHPA